LKEYEDLKVENVLLNLCCEALGLQEGELVKWWEEVHDMFKEDLQQMLQHVRVNEQFYHHQIETYKIAFLDFQYIPQYWVQNHHQVVFTIKQILVAFDWIHPRANMPNKRHQFLLM
jgi:hypothetical protein